MIPKQILDKARIDMQDVADIAAMTGVSYFKGAFRKKGFDGTPWPLAKKDKAGTRRRGSLMIDSAALMNSIRIARATPQEVVWTAGNAKVPYAEVHNTGGRAGRGRGFQMPRRQYMGDAEELRQKIIARLKAYMQSRIKCRRGPRGSLLSSDHFISRRMDDGGSLALCPSCTPGRV